MKNTTISIGIIGTGRVAQAHLEAFKNSSLMNVELSAVCDSDIKKAEAAAKQYSVKKTYTDYRELADDAQIDAVIVCLPNHLHHPVVMHLAQSGKHILVEKPMASNVHEADEMIECAWKNNVRLMVGQSRRFMRGVAAARNRLSEIGKVFRIDIKFLVSFPKPQTPWWKDGDKTGPLVIPLQGSHSLDTIVWLLDAVPSNVFTVSKLFNPVFGSADESSIVLGFDSGEIASVQLSLNTTPYVHETLITGDKGTIRIYEYPTEKIYGFRNKVMLNDTCIFDEEELPSPYGIQLSEFISSIREEREPIASGRDVRRSMQVLDAACESSQTGSVVRL